MTDFTYNGFHELLYRLKTNNTFLQNYNRFYYRLSDAMASPDCDNNCKTDLINLIIVADAYRTQPLPDV